MGKHPGWDWGDVLAGLMVLLALGIAIAIAVFCGIVAVHFVVKYW